MSADSQARAQYEKQMHKDQAMRSMQLAQNGVHPPPGFAPHTPNMSALDAVSPATMTQPIGVGQSPRNATSARAMARDVSKSGIGLGGSMLPPQSPATTVNARSSTPKPGANASKTPKQKEELLTATPKSVQPSPSNTLVPVPPEHSAPNSVSHGLTPSPPGSKPTPSQQNDQGASSQAPTSIPSLSTDSGALSYGSTEPTTDPGIFGSDFDFDSLMNTGEGTFNLDGGFDFGQYLAELGDDSNDSGEIGLVP